MNSKLFFDNSLYAEAFLGHLLDHPEDAERIPEGAVIMFSPEYLDPGFSATNRLVLRAPEAFRGRVIVPVGVREVEAAAHCYEFLFPWTGSDTWLRFSENPWLQESLSATLGVQPTKQIWDFSAPALFVAPRFEPVFGREQAR